MTTRRKNILAEVNKCFQQDKSIFLGHISTVTKGARNYAKLTRQEINVIISEINLSVLTMVISNTVFHQ